MGFFKHETALVSDKAKIGNDTRIWAFTNIHGGAVIGKGCNVCDGTSVEGGVVIGNNVTIKHHVSLFEGVTIEDDVFIGSNIAFINDRLPRSKNKDWKLERTVVKKGASIGTNATVLCGLTIGEYAVIGAGSVVTRDVPAYTVVFGNPAKMRGHVCQCGKKLDDQFICSCGKKYSMDNYEIKLQS